jgi:hypothetical protein
MIDRFFLIVLLLNATGLFRFVAPLFGVSIGQVSLVLLVVNVFYLIVKMNYSTALLLRGGIGGWLFVLVVWPLTTTLYAPLIEIREIGLLLYCFSLFFGAAVYTAANGLPAMHRILSVSMAVTIVGLGLSMLMPQSFETVAALARAETEEMGRPFGFFLEPNKLAIATGFLFVGWFSLWRRKNTLLEVPVILAFLLVMLLTGSRTGMLAAVIIVALIVRHSWRKQVRSTRQLLKTCVLAACMAAGIIGASHYLSNVGDSVARRKDDLIDRMEALLSFKFSSDGGLGEDISVRRRFRAQEVYWPLVREKPLLGHGFGSDTYYQDNGAIIVPSHSAALTCAMEYGVLYPLALSLLMLQLYRKRSRRDVEGVFHTNSILQFVSILFSFFLVSGDVLHVRTFYIVFGMFFTAVYYPRYVFSYDESTGKINSCMTRREIAKRFGRKRGLRRPLEPLPSAESGMAEEGKASG